MKWEAVIFDVFGTLIPISGARSPYRPLMKWMQESGRRPQPDDATILLSKNFELRDIGSIFGISPPHELVIRCENELKLELLSMHLYADVERTLYLLKQSGVRIGLCSNLATGYGSRVLQLLPNLDAYIFSYQIGAVKPDPIIYKQALKQLGCSAQSVLFIGDSLIADINGPQACGIATRFLDRKAGHNLDDLLSDLF
jgi:HAD superfamily hydrolase (TIGR01509 family)